MRTGSAARFGAGRCGPRPAGRDEAAGVPRAALVRVEERVRVAEADRPGEDVRVAMVLNLSGRTRAVGEPPVQGRACRRPGPL